MRFGKEHCQRAGVLRVGGAHDLVVDAAQIDLAFVETECAPPAELAPRHGCELCLALSQCGRAPFDMRLPARFAFMLRRLYWRNPTIAGGQLEQLPTHTGADFHTTFTRSACTRRTPPHL